MQVKLPFLIPQYNNINKSKNLCNKFCVTHIKRFLVNVTKACFLKKVNILSSDLFEQKKNVNFFQATVIKNQKNAFFRHFFSENLTFRQSNLCFLLSFKTKNLKFILETILSKGFYKKACSIFFLLSWQQTAAFIVISS